MNHNKKVLDEKLWKMHLTRQFRWTQPLRDLIYSKIELEKQNKILDAGCGIGLIANEIQEKTGGEVYGIDINEKLVKMAKENCPKGSFSVGSVQSLPFEDDYFDVSFCHMVLMWVKNPYLAVSEMKRVTRPGGWVVCAAEPDYGGKIDFPEDMGVGQSNIRALQYEGADPYFGRKIKSAMSKAGLKPEIGIWANLWDDEEMKKEFEKNWEFASLTARGPFQKDFVDMAKKRDMEALERGERVTFLPVFWGVAQKA